jgi:hypothetical protein
MALMIMLFMMALVTVLFVMSIIAWCSDGIDDLEAHGFRVGLDCSYGINYTLIQAVFKSFCNNLIRFIELPEATT